VKGFHWLIVGIGIVLSISSIRFQVDDPITAYDESETSLYLVLADNSVTVARPLTLRDARITVFVKKERVRRNDETTGCPSQLNFLSTTLLC
jgi:hypothetical protein